MENPLVGKVALVTGASRNIGRSIACALADDGADIVVHVGRDEAAGRETVAEVEKRGRRALLISGDLSDPEKAPALVRQAGEAFGRIDILVNNAAIRPEASIREMRFADWRNVMGVALDAVFLVCQAALPYLEKSDAGTIINLGGMTGHTGAAHRAHVIAAKAGVVGFTKALAHELAEDNITVNCIAPGLIDTVRAGGGPKHHASAKNLVGRRGTADEVAAAVAYFAGPSARYVTGQTLHLNGGAYLP